MQYMKPLDSIRGIAVLLVIVSHWLPILHFGGFIGVSTFFVLSGFLITNILLDNKNKAEELGLSKLLVIKNFFFRRALRIFPIYFLVVISLYLLGEGRIPNIKEEIGYLLTFTINYHFANLQYFGKFTAHLWSLSVEEQFYLVWPWLIIFLKRKYLPFTIGLSVLTGFIFQLFITDASDYITTQNCLDAFGIGALFAWIYTYKPQLVKKAYHISGIVFLLYLGITLLHIYGFIPILPPTRTLVSLFAVWVISYIVYNTANYKKLRFSFLLNSKKLIFIGKISYGVYLYHFYLPFLTYRLSDYVEQLLPSLLRPYSFILFAISIFGLVILVSWLSWRFIEMPVMRLKKYFEYRKPATGAHQENMVYKPTSLINQ